MQWTPPWNRSLAFGAVDTSVITEDFVDKLARALKRRGAFESYAKRAWYLGEARATEEFVRELLNPVALSLSTRSRPYAIQFQFSADARVTAEAFPYRDPTDGKTKVAVVVALTPLPRASESAFYGELKRVSVIQLPHELQHVPQLLAKIEKGITTGREYHEGPQRGPAYWRLYLSDPLEVPAMATQIAGELRAAGITRFGFPASREARKASFIVGKLYRYFDPANPADARLLKDYAIKVAKFL